MWAPDRSFLTFTDPPRTRLPHSSELLLFGDLYWCVRNTLARRRLTQHLVFGTYAPLVPLSKMPTQREEEQAAGVAGNDHLILTTPHQWLFNNPMEAVKYAAPVAGVVLAGPLVSLQPLGSFTLLISMVVTFMAGSTSKHNAVDGAYVSSGRRYAGIRCSDPSFLKLLEIRKNDR
jgi:hypothetical protein